MVEGEKVAMRGSFLKPSCGIEEIWKTGSKREEAAGVSHGSHRERKRACVKTGDCVKRASGVAPDKGLQETSNAQV